MYIILCILCLLLNGCTTPTRTLTVNKLNSYFKNNYSLEDGNLIALYDLMELTKRAEIYATNYGLIINDKDCYKSFLEQCDNKFTSNNRSYSVKINSKLDEIAYHKIIRLKNLILDLNNRYSLLSKSDENIVRSNNLHNNSKYFKELAYLDKLISNLPLMLPMYGTSITSNYGPRNIGRKKTKFHHGIDFQAKHHALIFAPGDGVVKSVCRLNGYGNVIDIMHLNNLITRYAHLHNMSVRVGDNVRRGDIIGIQGRTGNAHGEHLHFEILYYNRSVNPMIFLGHFFIPDSSALVRSGNVSKPKNKKNISDTKNELSKPKSKPSTSSSNTVKSKLLKHKSITNPKSNVKVKKSKTILNAKSIKKSKK